mmetsp:Transcript_44667/g.69904  ORF Transcript_44667/g.69904 Transcript_44667/m.69904 type:complete len:87 (+) Transcript_44667:971-1231(+)
MNRPAIGEIFQSCERHPSLSGELRDQEMVCQLLRPSLYDRGGILAPIASLCRCISCSKLDLLTKLMPYRVFHHSKIDPMVLMFDVL